MKNYIKTSTTQNILKILLALFMVFSGFSHLTFNRVEFQAQVPEWLPMSKDLVVILSGIVEMIRPAAWNPSVIADCSHLFIFAAGILTHQSALIKCLILLMKLGVSKMKVGRIIDRCCWIITHKEMQKSTLIMPQNKPTSLFLKPYQQQLFKV